MSGASLGDSVMVSADVVFREIAGEIVLLDLQSGTYFGLNEVGARIWTLIQQHALLRRVFDIAQAEYAVAPKDLERDLLDLVDELRRKGLVSVSSGPR